MSAKNSYEKCKLVGRTSVREPENRVTMMESRWFLPDTEKNSGTVLLLHGLNQNPVSWNPVINQLTSCGLRVYRLGLSGHRGRGFAEMLQVSTQSWLDEFKNGYEEVKENGNGKPLYLVAFSLGGLLAMVVQLQLGFSMFQKQFLFAPALALKSYTYLAYWATRIVPYLPSRATGKYIANRRGTSGSAYKALFDLLNEFQQYQTFEQLNVPTKIVMRTSDELISYKDIVRLVKENLLNQWQLELLPEDRAVSNSLCYKHLIIDKECLGEQGWNHLNNLIEDFFRDNNVPDPESEV